MSQKARAGGGHLTWLGIHWLDLAMYVTGSRITHVAGFSGNVGGQPIDTEDSAAISLRFANGTFGTLTSGYYLDRGKHLFVKVWGSEGWLELNPGTANPLEWYSTKSGKPESQRYAPATPSSGNIGFLGHVMRAAMGKETPVLTPDESLYVLQTISAAYKAAETGHTQPVAPSSSGIDMTKIVRKVAGRAWLRSKVSAIGLTPPRSPKSDFSQSRQQREKDLLTDETRSVDSSPNDVSEGGHPEWSLPTRNGKAASAMAMSRRSPTRGTERNDALRMRIFFE